MINFIKNGFFHSERYDLSLSDRQANQQHLVIAGGVGCGQTALSYQLLDDARSTDATVIVIGALADYPTTVSPKVNIYRATAESSAATLDTAFINLLLVTDPQQVMATPAPLLARALTDITHHMTQTNTAVICLIKDMARYCQDDVGALRDALTHFYQAAKTTESLLITTFEHLGQCFEDPIATYIYEQSGQQFILEQPHTHPIDTFVNTHPDDLSDGEVSVIEQLEQGYLPDEPKMLVKPEQYELRLLSPQQAVGYPECLYYKHVLALTLTLLHGVT